MIVTHTENADGQRRVYLGGKASLECYVTPHADGKRWSFHIEEDLAGAPLSPEQKRHWATHMLLQLAQELRVSPDALRGVPFETICALHTADPNSGKRIASSKKAIAAQCFSPVGPHVTRPDFTAQDYANGRRRSF